MQTVWVDEWLDQWKYGDAVITRVTKEGTPGRSSTGGEYHFREHYHVYPERELVVLQYDTSGDYFYCPGCGSFISAGQWKEHKEYCTMTVEPLAQWLHSRREVKCHECGGKTTLEALAASGWCCPECKHSKFDALW